MIFSFSLHLLFYYVSGYIIYMYPFPLLSTIWSFLVLYRFAYSLWTFCTESSTSSLVIVCPSSVYSSLCTVFSSEFLYILFFSRPHTFFVPHSNCPSFLLLSFLTFPFWLTFNFIFFTLCTGLCYRFYELCLYFLAVLCKFGKFATPYATSIVTRMHLLWSTILTTK